MASLLESRVDTQAIMENFELVLLCIDELVDNGIVLETDARAILDRVAVRSGAGGGGISAGGGDGSGSLTTGGSELSIGKVLGAAKTTGAAAAAARARGRGGRLTRPRSVQGPHVDLANPPHTQYTLLGTESIQ